MSLSKREQRLVVITIVVAVVGVSFAYVYRPLSEWRSASIERLPELTQTYEETQSLKGRRLRLEKRIAELKEDMGNPKAELVPYAERLDAQKKLAEMFQNMGLDKPYTIRPGSIVPHDDFDTLEYSIEGKMDWNKFTNNLNDFEWHDRYLSVHHIRLKREGKVQVSMRITLYLAKEGMEPPEKPADESAEKTDEKPKPNA